MISSESSQLEAGFKNSKSQILKWLPVYTWRFEDVAWAREKIVEKINRVNVLLESQ